MTCRWLLCHTVVVVVVVVMSGGGGGSPSHWLLVHSYQQRGGCQCALQGGLLAAGTDTLVTQH